MESEGTQILKLNIGNPTPFGLFGPAEIVQDIQRNLADCQGYSDAKGLYPARKAVVQYYQTQGVANVAVEDVYLGNGVSELILMSLQALLNPGDQVLVPAPDYPLWTAAVTLSGGAPVHYRCLETNDWQPDLADIEAKVTPATRALVLINPNNPTGAVYSEDTLRAILGLARAHRLVVFADEIYDKILFEDAWHHTAAALAEDVPVVSFGGLSKNYRVAGYRAGWMLVSGDKDRARDYIEGLNLLATMRLCANVPGQHAIQTALGGTQSIDALVRPGGRLRRQRDYAWAQLNALPGVSCVKPQGSLYLFPKLDPARYPITDDAAFVLELLRQERLLLVQGSAFNWPDTQHLRLTFLPHVDELEQVFERLRRFLTRYARG